MLKTSNAHNSSSIRPIGTKFGMWACNVDSYDFRSATILNPAAILDFSNTLTFRLPIVPKRLEITRRGRRLVIVYRRRPFERRRPRSAIAATVPEIRGCQQKRDSPMSMLNSNSHRNRGTVIAGTVTVVVEGIHIAPHCNRCTQKRASAKREEG